MRPTTIYAAILGERGAGEACDPYGVRGNADEQYPRPLTCDVCGFRPKGKPVEDVFAWYWLESDPLPDGWVILKHDAYGCRCTFCPQCYADRDQFEERDEEEYDY